MGIQFANHAWLTDAWFRFVDIGAELHTDTLDQILDWDAAPNF